jgi:hypothetical protein
LHRPKPRGTLTFVKDQAFYVAAAGVIPILFLAVAIEIHAFRIRDLPAEPVNVALAVLRVIADPRPLWLRVGPSPTLVLKDESAPEVMARILAAVLFLIPIAGEVAALAALESGHSDWVLATLVWTSIAILFFFIGRGALYIPKSQASASADVEQPSIFAKPS